VMMVIDFSNRATLWIFALLWDFHSPGIRCDRRGTSGTGNNNATQSGLDDY